MIEANPETKIKSMIREGSVFYFSEETFTTDAPHYFVVLNKSPLTDPSIILVVAVTLDIKVVERIEKTNLPRETYVDINPDDCSFLKSSTLFDCNNIFTKSIDELAEKLNQKKLKIINRIENPIIERIKKGVLVSPLVTREIKNLIAKSIS